MIHIIIPRALPARRALAALAAVCLSVCCPAVTASADDSDSPGQALWRDGVQVAPRADTPDLPHGISALSWIVADARTGKVLAAKDAHRRLPPASTLKTLFALTVLPKFDPDAVHRVTEEDLAGVEAGSSLVGVAEGQTYTVADLWRGVFLRSGNDAVHVLASMNGSVPHTVEEMQAKADMLGAYDTRVVTPDGYDEPGQYSSAYDLSLFARAGLSTRYFTDYTSTQAAWFPGGGPAEAPYRIVNTNHLLTGADGVGWYPGLIGVKNGYTTKAGNTVVVAAHDGDRTLIVTVMNPQSGKPQAIYNEAGYLLDWGFAAADSTASVGTLNTVDVSGHSTRRVMAGVEGAAGTASSGSGTGTVPFQHARVPAADPATAAPTPASASADTEAPSVALMWYAAVAGALALAVGTTVVCLRRRARGRGVRLP